MPQSFVPPDQTGLMMADPSMAQPGEMQKLEKVIPGTPEGVVPVHLRRKQIFANPNGLTFLSGGDIVGPPFEPKASAPAQSQ